MRCGVLASVLLVILAVQGAPANAAVEWTRLRSQNFTFEGDVSEGELRAVARRFEQFREVLGRLLPKARLVTPTPLTVLVFSHDRGFKAVRPLFEGKAVEATGYAVVTSVGTSVAISLEGGENAYRVIYHEYAHLLVSNALPRLPLWLEEGLAEYFSTFELSSNSRRAIVGRPVSLQEVRLLRGRDLLPMSELLAADHNSRLYNVSADRSRFYVQSWALVHYLLLGSPGRAGQFGDFVNRVASGATADAAFAAAFPSADKLPAELSEYVNQFAFSAIEFRFPDEVSSDVRYVLSRMSPAESEASIGHQLLRQRRFSEAESRFRAAMKLDPSTPSAHTGVGLLELLQDRPLEALAPLRKGAELADNDAMAHFALGLAALRCSSAECGKQQGGIDTARKEFLRAVEILPGFPDALSYLGYAEAATGAGLADAERHVLSAISLLPGREDYRLHLAQIYMQQENVAKAQAVLGPIAAASPSVGNKTLARQLLGQMADMQNAKAARETAAAGSAPSSADGRSVAANDGPPPGGGRQALYRTVGDGERRLDGMLEAIECTPGEIVIVVRDASGPHRFSAPKFEAIEFITYRDDMKGTVTCGPQGRAMRVYLTSRQPAKDEAKLATGLEGVAVAVEYLPVQK